ncbi:MAG: histidine kinase [Solobacterium sp.]|nr:histidine kinase [Solobacterium sp.]
MTKRRSLKNSMLSMLFISWLLPLLVIVVLLTGMISRSLNKQINRTISTTTEKAVEICTLRLNDCITQSKDISYNGRLREIYESYLTNGNEAELYAGTSSLLEEKYKFNDDYKMTGLYYTAMPDKFYFTGSTYLNNSQRMFYAYGKEAVMEASQHIDTDTVLITAANRIYLVRNVMDHSFHPYAVLFMELNDTRIFESLRSVWRFKGYTVFCNETELFSETGDDVSLDYLDMIGNRNIEFSGTDLIYHRYDLGTNRMVYAVQFDREAVNRELHVPAQVFVVMMVFIIPLIGLLLNFFNKRVSIPVEELAAASGEITKGNYGAVVPVHTENGEIADLDTNFNEMSLKLKDQFEKIYLEEIALRDANIHALQSQINPHFLNNTLEIINWEARLGGNDKVAEMIEALATMMSATLNRDKKPLITLREELDYVDAYLYIIQCRFGEKFICTRSIEHKEAFEYMVPRLIIQPIIENSVEHGRDDSGAGYVTVTIRGGETAGSDLYIVIENKGELSEEDKEKIKQLLSDEETPLKHASHIGIRNVNKRLKMLYGEGSGLTIESDGKGTTVSTIIVKKSQP